MQQLAEVEGALRGLERERVAARLEDRERPARQRLGFARSPLLLERDRQVAERCRDVGVIGAETPLADPERGAEVPLRRLVVPARQHHGAEPVRDPRRVDLAVGAVRPRQVERAAEQLFGALLVADLAVDRAEDVEHLRLDAGARGHRVDPLRAAVEQLPGGRLLAERRAGIARPEEAEEEVGHLPRLGRLGARDVALAHRLAPLEEGERAEGDHRRGRHGGGRDRDPVAPGELARAVAQADRARLDRQTAPPPPQVVGERLGRGVALDPAPCAAP